MITVLLCLVWQVFVGLGFPYEGPAPIEAIALGCVFLQPQFDPPHSSDNNDFYKGKPTTRQVDTGKKKICWYNTAADQLKIS